MIEKLDSKMEYVEISILGDKKAECLDFEAGRRLNLKINELVDTVNELQTRPENVQPDVESRPENVQDEFAEQRKWIGKICKFWDFESETPKHFGILTRIDETAIVKYGANNGFWYCNCEPVKPDDDIIYKGE